MECFCYLRNVHDKMSDDKTAFEKRYGQKFDGPPIPFGTLVEYIPITAKAKSSVHQFGKKTLKGIFLGCVLRACKDNTSNDPFSRWKSVHLLATDEIDDHRIRSDCKCTIGLKIQKERTLYLVLRLRGETEHDTNDNATTKIQTDFHTKHMKLCT